MNYDFVEKYRQPKRTGNIICDLNPFSKLNLMVVLGLASLIVQNYIFGFCMVAFIILVAVKAGCFKSFFSLYWKIFYLSVTFSQKRKIYLRSAGCPIPVFVVCFLQKGRGSHEYLCDRNDR